MEAKEEELRSWKENKVYKEIVKRGNVGIPTMWIMTKKNQKWRRKVESKIGGERIRGERNRVINYWNHLTDIVVSCKSLNTFKIKLDEFMTGKGEV